MENCPSVFWQRRRKRNAAGFAQRLVQHPIPLTTMNNTLRVFRILKIPKDSSTAGFFKRMKVKNYLDLQQYFVAEVVAVEEEWPKEPWAWQLEWRRFAEQVEPVFSEVSFVVLVHLLHLLEVNLQCLTIDYRNQNHRRLLWFFVLYVLYVLVCFARQV